MKLTAIIKTSLVKVMDRLLAKRKALVSYYRQDKSRSDFFDLYKKIQKEVSFLLNFNEAYQIYMDVKNTAGIPGAIAEVGPYMGGSSKIICEAKDGKNFYIFDTFEGLPPSTTGDDGGFSQGDFDAKGITSDLFSFVKNYLKGYSNVHIYKGIFPEKNSEAVVGERFSFIHLDVDIYVSTKQSLEFFYPRLNKGGILVSHDYENSPGVRKAFNEFFVDKPEPVVQIFAGQQCLIVKQ